MNTTFAALAESTMLILEAQFVQASDTPEGRKHYKLLKRKLEAYFRKIQKSFPTTKTAGIYTKRAEPREAATEIERELMLVYNEWIGGHKEALHAVLEESIEQSTKDGFTGSLGSWIDKYKLKPPPAGLDALVPKPVLKWAKEHSATMVKRISEETATRMAGVVARAIEDQKGIPGLAREIRTTFEDMTKYRSELIAKTETNAAFSKAERAAADAVGSKQKEWIQPSGYPDECADNAAQGRIKIDEPFSSGADETPEHPGCTCTVVYYGATRTNVEKVIAA